jgi:hypothetical protein
MRPWSSWVLGVVVLVCSNMKPVKDFDKQENPVSRSGMSSFEHGAKYILDLRVFLVTTWFEISLVKCLFES